MMNIAEYAIRYRTITLIFMLVTLVGGVISYQNLPRLEDPEFTIKEAVISTPYPGATPEEVEEEVTDRIEKAVQLLGQLKRVKESRSERGLSIVRAEIKDKYDKNGLPQVWDELRRKIGDVQNQLPPGAGPSLVNDDFGDVYGTFYAITGDGYSYAEIKEFAKFLQRELLLVHDVKRIELYGVQDEVVYVKFSRQKLANLGVSQESIFQSLAQKNVVASAGRVEVGSEYLPIDPTGAFTSVDEMKNLLISSPGADQQVYLGDVAEIERGYREPSRVRLLYDGQPAVGLAISTVMGGNVVTMGEAVDKRLDELEARAPVGMEIHAVSLQAEAVTQAVDSFVVNLLEAVAIVVVVLLVFMGPRSGLIIGFVLFLTICGTLIIMDIYQITLERISLGALIIALGMLVDNAIVVTEGMLVRIEQGEDRIAAANAVVRQNMIPLLGATIIAVVAFGPIGLSSDSTGEYCRSLFTVLLISLMFSWVTAVTVTPLLCYMFLKGKDDPPGPLGRLLTPLKTQLAKLPVIGARFAPDAKEQEQEQDPYAGFMFRAYKWFLETCLRFRFLTVAVVIVLLAAAIYAFGYIESSFFPPSTRPQFMVDIWLPYGTYIDETEKIADRVEQHLRETYPDDIPHISTFVGQGAPRFLLTYNSEQPDSSYVQLLVDVNDAERIDEMRLEIQQWLDENLIDATANVKKFLLGPGEGGKIQCRVSGPDPVKLRELSDEVAGIMDDEPNSVSIRSTWRERTKVIRPVLSEQRARRLGIERPNVAQALETAYTGTTAGVYRDGDELLSIIARPPESERGDVSNLKDILVYSPAAQRTVPINQVTNEFETVWEDPLVFRRNRIRTVTLHCDPREGNASVLLDRIMPKVAALELPPGFFIEWGGEYESSQNGQAGLMANIPTFLLIMVLTVICLFNAIRQPLIIWLCVPLAIIGISFGLLVTSQPFGFMALLGALSLSGMLIKNSIVLLDQINIERQAGKAPYTAVVDSCVARMRPVLMAAVTTIMGMIPLVLDAFFAAMAVAIMFGLAFATVLTLIVVPVLYAIFFWIPSRRPAPAAAGEK